MQNKNGHLKQILTFKKSWNTIETYLMFPWHLTYYLHLWAVWIKGRPADLTAPRKISQIFIFYQNYLRSPLYLLHPEFCQHTVPLTSIKQNISSESFFSTEIVFCKKCIKKYLYILWLFSKNLRFKLLLKF